MNSGVLILGVALFAVVLIHELGHLAAARYFGVTVSSVTIGLGPEILGVTDRFGTRWKLAALPIGGSCGFSPDTARPAKEPREQTFVVPSLRERAVILASGPFANIALAITLLVILLCIRSDLETAVLEKREFGYALLVCGFSISVGLFNLLPLLPMDGGWLLLIAIEVYRGRPNPAWVQRSLWAASALSAALAVLGAIFVWIWPLT